MASEYIFGKAVKLVLKDKKLLLTVKFTVGFLLVT